MKTKQLIVRVAVLVLSCGLVLGCATKVPIEVEKAPTIDTKWIRTLVFVPFATSDGSGRQQQIAAYIDDQTRSAIVGTGRFNLVDAQSVDAVPPDADAIFTGKVTLFTVNDTSQQVEHIRLNTEGKQEKYTVTMYTRKVTLAFTYTILRARDRSHHANQTRSGVVSVSKESSHALTDPVEMARTIVDKQLNTLARDVAPWRARETRTLEKETLKDKELRRRMKAAAKLVKAGSYQEALDEYTDLCAVYPDSFAAGYNQAMMTQIVGDLDGAIRLMSALATKTGNPKAKSELRRMERTRGEKQEVVEDYSAPSEGVMGAALKRVAAELGAKLNGMNISLEKGETDNPQLTAYSIGELTKQLAGSVTIVDRTSQQFIDAEQQFQLSGAVDDAELVSLGHLIGAEAIVVCSVNGTGSLRRLVVKAVSVETGQSLCEISEEF